jgi:prevent-host-death family protein
MTTVPADEAAAHFSELLDRVAQGEEIVISREGAPCARLSRVPRADGRARGISWGAYRGRIVLASDFDDDLPEDMLEAMEGRDEQP